MRAYVVALFMAGSTLVAGAVLADSAWGQTDPPRPAVAAADSTPIGKVLLATGSVTIEHATAVVLQAKLPSGVGQTKVGDFVYQGDVVQTGADGKVGIGFTDGTAFNLSSNARMVLNEFVYDPKGKSNSTLFSLSKGTFTFVAGKVAKTGNMKIDTPVATMGIRGTTPHVEISDDGKVSFSTLIEESKKARQKRGALDGNKRAAQQGQRQASGTSGTTASAPPAEKNLDIKLKICRGC